MLQLFDREAPGCFGPEEGSSWLVFSKRQGVYRRSRRIERSADPLEKKRNETIQEEEGAGPVALNKYQGVRERKSTHRQHDIEERANEGEVCDARGTWKEPMIAHQFGSLAESETFSWAIACASDWIDFLVGSPEPMRCDGRRHHRRFHSWSRMD